jgi:hypothetical protein
VPGRHEPASAIRRDGGAPADDRPRAPSARLPPAPSTVSRSNRLLALSAAISKDIGLIATFGGIGVIVNGLLVYIAIQIRGERQQNLELQSGRHNHDTV